MNFYSTLRALVLLLLTASLVSLSKDAVAKLSDSYIWLEDIEAEKSLDWVRQHNEKTTQEFAIENKKSFNKNYKGILKMLESNAKIAYPSVMNEYVYNFWRDQKHIKGIWRRQKIEDYEKRRSKWQILVDFDQISRVENKNWVFKGVTCLEPNPKHCLIRFSDGGKDAVELREFDLEKAKFVEQGFFIPEAKSRISWKDKDALYVAICDSKSSCTDSGYPKTVQILKRGQSVDQAEKLMSTQQKNMSISAFRIHHNDHEMNLIAESLDFYNNKFYKIGKGNKHIQLQLPTSTRIYEYYNGQPLVYFLEKGIVKNQDVSAGSLLAIDFDNKGRVKNFKTIFEPKFFGSDFSRRSLNDIIVTKDRMILSYSEDLEDKIEVVQIHDDKILRHWVKSPSANATLRIAEGFANTDKFYFTAENINLPTTLFGYDLSEPTPRKIQGLPNFYKTGKIRVQKSFAKSKDGTLIPYFVVSDGNLKLDGMNKVLISGYGGFNISRKLTYSPTIGKYWLNKKNIYVIANIRGGGEYGPGWHKAAIKENKQRSYEDFIAITEDLINKKVTQPKNIAIMGGSNGGLLVGAVSMQRPELFGAVVSLVPLLDMMRYHKLLAGASWMSEYGDPEKTKERNFIKKYSPYHNIKKDTSYPQFLFYTSTKDDRVHPGHARKMVAKMEELDISDIYLYENTEGGHAGSSSYKEAAHQWALIFEFLQKGLNQ